MYFLKYQKYPFAYARKDYISRNPDLMECVPPVGSVVQSRVRISSDRVVLSLVTNYHVTFTWPSRDWLFIGIYVQFEYDWLQVLSYRHFLSGNIMLSSGKIFLERNDILELLCQMNQASSIRVTLLKYSFIPLGNKIWKTLDKNGRF